MVADSSGRDYEQRVFQHIVGNIDTDNPFDVVQPPDGYPCTGAYLYDEIKRQFRKRQPNLQTGMIGDRVCYRTCGVGAIVIIRTSVQLMAVP
jgi:hypothetical protein